MGFSIEASLRHFSIQIAYRSEDPGNTHEIYGLRAGVYNSHSPADHFTGLELGIANVERGDCSGLALGLYNAARDFDGASLAIMNVARDMTGFNVGIVNAAEGHFDGNGNMAGVQISAWNSASQNMTGVQVGILLNMATYMYGAQLGVVNMARNLWQGGAQLLFPVNTDPLR